MGLFSSIASIAAPILGSAISGASSFFGQQAANDASERSVQRQLDFQERSYKSRYQWQMEDMVQAGLNPMLSYQTGAGGALPGAAYTAQNELAGVGGAVNSAFANRMKGAEVDRAEKQVEQLNADIKLKDEQATKTAWDTFLTKAQTDESMARSGKEQWLKELIKNQSKIAEQNIHSARASAAISKEDEKFYQTDLGKFMRMLDRFGTNLNPFASSAKTVKGATN